MVFFTPGSTRSLTLCPRLTPEGLRRHGAAPVPGRRWLGWLLAVWLVFSGVAGGAQAAELKQLAAQRTSDGLYLWSNVQLDAAAALESALERSVPFYFVVQADVYRERWYWADHKVASATRTYRLAYQPLTRRWRVSTSTASGPPTGLQYALHQNFETLSEALAVVSRVSRWKVADASVLETDASHYLEFRFKLDMALLPRPFQLGMNSQRDWNIELRKVVGLPKDIQDPVVDDGTPSAVDDVPPAPETGSGVRQP
jgi:hypothetical protein